MLLLPLAGNASLVDSHHWPLIQQKLARNRERCVLSRADVARMRHVAILSRSGGDMEKNALNIS